MFFEALKHVRKKFIGTKKDKVTSYTENELLNFMDLSYNNLKSGTSYFYSVTAFNSNG